MRRSLFSVTAAAAIVVSLAACGGGAGAQEPTPTPSQSSAAASPSPTPTEEPAITPASLLAKTSGALGAAGSYAFSVTATNRGTAQTGTGRVLASTTGDTSIQVSATADGQTVGLVLVGGRVYLDGTAAEAPGYWFDLTDSTVPDTTSMTSGFVDWATPLTALSKLPAGAIQVVRGEASTVDGVKVTEYRVSMSLEDLAKIAGEDLTADESAQLAAAPAGSLGMLLLVDADYRPVKVTIAMGDVLKQEMTLSGFGTQQPVAAPDAGAVVPGSEIGM